MKFKDLSIGKKIGLNVVIISISLFFLLILTTSKINDIENSATLTRDKSAQFAILAEQAEKHVIQVQQWLTNISATRGMEGFDDGFAEAEKHAVAFNEILSQFREMFVEKNDTEMVHSIDKLSADFKDFYKVGHEMADVYIKQGPKAGNAYMEKFDPFAAKIAEKMGALVTSQIEDLNTNMDFIVSNTHKLLVFTFISICVVLGVAIFFGFIVARGISVPLKECNTIAKDISNSDGDLTKQLKLNRKDEIGLLADSFDRMIENIRRTLFKVYQDSAIVLSSTKQLSISSKEMSNSSQKMSEQSNSVAAASEEISANIKSIAETAELMTSKADDVEINSNEMSDSVSNVAAAIEEMSASIQEVSGNCVKAQDVAFRAKEKSDQSSIMMSELDEVAQNIGQVVDVITEITEQTKLLALNATIEAARAGEAGKGFAVVANEVKDLAKQTAEATNDITDRTQAMQDKTKGVVKMIQEVSSTNQEMNEVNTVIAAAVEEQSATVGEVAKTIAETALKTGEVSEIIQSFTTAIKEDIAVNVKEASLGISEVSANIQQIDIAAQDSFSFAAGNNTFAEELSKVAAQLSDEISEFKLGSERFDIGTVKAAHLAWQSRLKGLLSGARLSLDSIPDHTQCDFGKWVASEEGQSLSALPSFQIMNDRHKEVHSLAYQIAESHQKGRIDESNTLMKKFEKTRKNLFETLDEMYSVA